MTHQNILEVSEHIKFMLHANKVVGKNAQHGVFWEVTLTNGRRRTIWLDDEIINPLDTIRIAAIALVGLAE